MKTLNKALVGTAAAAAMAVSATPAMARDKDNGISAGEVLAGVAVVGAIAAIASSGKKDRGYYNGGYDRGYYGDRHYRDGYRHNYRRIGKRKAIKRCIRAAENRVPTRGRATVTRIRDVDRTRYGYRVKGRIVVEQGRYGRYVDKGRFTCRIDGRRVTGVRYRGLEYARRY